MDTNEKLRAAIGSIDVKAKLDKMLGVKAPVVVVEQQ